MFWQQPPWPLVPCLQQAPAPRCPQEGFAARPRVATGPGVFWAGGALQEWLTVSVHSGAATYLVPSPTEALERLAHVQQAGALGPVSWPGLWSFAMSFARTSPREARAWPPVLAGMVTAPAVRGLSSEGRGAGPGSQCLTLFFVYRDSFQVKSRELPSEGGERSCCGWSRGWGPPSAPSEVPGSGFQGLPASV